MQDFLDNFRMERLNIWFSPFIGQIFSLNGILTFNFSWSARGNNFASFKNINLIGSKEKLVRGGDGHHDHKYDDIKGSNHGSQED